MIRSISMFPVTDVQGTVFKTYRPLRDQDANMRCHMENFERYVWQLKKLVAKERTIAANAQVATLAPPSDPSHTLNPDLESVMSKGPFELFLSEQTRPKTLNPVFGFLKLRGHSHNDAATFPDIKYGNSTPVIVKVIRDAILRIPSVTIAIRKRLIYFRRSPRN